MRPASSRSTPADAFRSSALASTNADITRFRSGALLDFALEFYATSFKVFGPGTRRQYVPVAHGPVCKDDTDSGAIKSIVFLGVGQRFL